MWTPRSMRVYPRPRGGAIETMHTGHEADGLSPPTRGSPRPEMRPPLRPGSIPAHAGEP